MARSLRNCTTNTNSNHDKMQEEYAEESKILNEKKSKTEADQVDCQNETDNKANPDFDGSDNPGTSSSNEAQNANEHANSSNSNFEYMDHDDDYSGEHNDQEEQGPIPHDVSEAVPDSHPQAEDIGHSPTTSISSTVNEVDGSDTPGTGSSNAAQDANKHAISSNSNFEYMDHADDYSGEHNDQEEQGLNLDDVSEAVPDGHPQEDSGHSSTTRSHQEMSTSSRKNSASMQNSNAPPNSEVLKNLVAINEFGIEESNQSPLEVNNDDETALLRSSSSPGGKNLKRERVVDGSTSGNDKSQKKKPKIDEIATKLTSNLKGRDGRNEEENMDIDDDVVFPSEHSSPNEKASRDIIKTEKMHQEEEKLTIGDSKIEKCEKEEGHSSQLMDVLDQKTIVKDVADKKDDKKNKSLDTAAHLRHLIDESGTASGNKIEEEGMETDEGVPPTEQQSSTEKVSDADKMEVDGKQQDDKKQTVIDGSKIEHKEEEETTLDVNQITGAVNLEANVQDKSNEVDNKKREDVGDGCKEATPQELGNEKNNSSPVPEENKTFKADQNIGTESLVLEAADLYDKNKTKIHEKEKHDTDHKVSCSGEDDKRSTDSEMENKNSSRSGKEVDALDGLGISTVKGSGTTQEIEKCEKEEGHSSQLMDSLDQKTMVKDVADKKDDKKYKSVDTAAHLRHLVDEFESASGNEIEEEKSETEKNVMSTPEQHSSEEKVSDADMMEVDDKHHEDKKQTVIDGSKLEHKEEKGTTLDVDQITDAVNQEANVKDESNELDNKKKEDVGDGCKKATPQELGNEKIKNSPVSEENKTFKADQNIGTESLVLESTQYDKNGTSNQEQEKHDTDHKGSRSGEDDKRSTDSEMENKNSSRSGKEVDALDGLDISTVKGSGTTQEIEKCEKEEGHSSQLTNVQDHKIIVKNIADKEEDKKNKSMVTAAHIGHLTDKFEASSGNKTEEEQMEIDNDVMSSSEQHSSSENSSDADMMEVDDKHHEDKKQTVIDVSEIEHKEEKETTLDVDQITDAVNQEANIKDEANKFDNKKREDVGDGCKEATPQEIGNEKNNSLPVLKENETLEANQRIGTESLVLESTQYDKNSTSNQEQEKHNTDHKGFRSGDDDKEVDALDGLDISTVKSSGTTEDVTDETIKANNPILTGNDEKNGESKDDNEDSVVANQEKDNEVNDSSESDSSDDNSERDKLEVGSSDSSSDEDSDDDERGTGATGANSETGSQGVTADHYDNDETNNQEQEKHNTDHEGSRSRDDDKRSTDSEMENKNSSRSGNDVDSLDGSEVPEVDRSFKVEEVVEQRKHSQDKKIDQVSTENVGRNNESGCSELKETMTDDSDVTDETIKANSSISTGNDENNKESKDYNGEAVGSDQKKDNEVNDSSESKSTVGGSSKHENRGAAADQHDKSETKNQEQEKHDNHPQGSGSGNDVDFSSESNETDDKCSVEMNETCSDVSNDEVITPNSPILASNDENNKESKDCNKKSVVANQKKDNEVNDSSESGGSDSDSEKDEDDDHLGSSSDDDSDHDDDDDNGKGGAIGSAGSSSTDENQGFAADQHDRNGRQDGETEEQGLRSGEENKKSTDSQMENKNKIDEVVDQQSLLCNSNPSEVVSENTLTTAENEKMVSSTDDLHSMETDENEKLNQVAQTVDELEDSKNCGKDQNELVRADETHNINHQKDENKNGYNVEEHNRDQTIVSTPGPLVAEEQDLIPNNTNMHGDIPGLNQELIDHNNLHPHLIEKDVTSMNKSHQDFSSPISLPLLGLSSTSSKDTEVCSNSDLLPLLRQLSTDDFDEKEDSSKDLYTETEPVYRSHDFSTSSSNGHNVEPQPTNIISNFKRVDNVSKVDTAFNGQLNDVQNGSSRNPTFDSFVPKDMVQPEINNAKEVDNNNSLDVCKLHGTEQAEKFTHNHTDAERNDDKKKLIVSDFSRTRDAHQLNTLNKNVPIEAASGNCPTNRKREFRNIETENSDALISKLNQTSLNHHNGMDSSSSSFASEPRLTSFDNIKKWVDEVIAANNTSGSIINKTTEETQALCEDEMYAKHVAAFEQKTPRYKKSGFPEGVSEDCWIRKQTELIGLSEVVEKDFKTKLEDLKTSLTMNICQAFEATRESIAALTIEEKVKTLNEIKTVQIETAKIILKELREKAEEQFLNIWEACTEMTFYYCEADTVYLNMKNQTDYITEGEQSEDRTIDHLEKKCEECIKEFLKEDHLPRSSTDDNQHELENGSSRDLHNLNTTTNNPSSQGENFENGDPNPQNSEHGAQNQQSTNLKTINTWYNPHVSGMNNVNSMNAGSSTRSPELSFDSPGSDTFLRGFSSNESADNQGELQQQNQQFDNGLKPSQSQQQQQQPHIPLQQHQVLSMQPQPELGMMELPEIAFQQEEQQRAIARNNAQDPIGPPTPKRKPGRPRKHKNDASTASVSSKRARPNSMETNQMQDQQFATCPQQQLQNGQQSSFSLPLPAPVFGYPAIQDLPMQDQLQHPQMMQNRMNPTQIHPSQQPLRHYDRHPTQRPNTSQNQEAPIAQVMRHRFDNAHMPFAPSGRMQLPMNHEGARQLADQHQYEMLMNQWHCSQYQVPFGVPPDMQYMSGDPQPVATPDWPQYMQSTNNAAPAQLMRGNGNAMQIPQHQYQEGYPQVPHQMPRPF